jgi:D-glycero-D-manno-heptose 1,7-bisphosphate phosphatase
MNKAVFIDKDGTLVEDIPYNIDPSLITLTPGAKEALVLLKSKGFLLIVISNQSGIARGYFKEVDLEKVKNRLQEMLAPHDVQLDGIFFCPHHPDGVISNYAISCDCRKPKPGMILCAAEAFEIDLSRSWMIGDILHDVESGNRAGCKTILIDNGNETEWILSEYRKPTAVANNLTEAAEKIIVHEHAHA